MFMGLLFVVLLVLLIRTNSRLARAEQRLILLEAGQRATAVQAAEPVVADVPAPSEEQREPSRDAPEPLLEPKWEPTPTASIPADPEAKPELVEELTKPASARTPISFEDLFGRKLPIWAGGATLAVAGFLIVKYSIDTGLLSPSIRVLLGLVFGTGLIAGAEAARRLSERVRDPRVAQSLAGAGVATLYGSVLVAGNLYQLIGSGTAFVGLAAVTALALALALRFGPPSALLGLIGGFAAPLFVGSAEPNLPLLILYLTLTVGGLSVLARAQGWAWLGYAAMAGGFLWSAVLIATSTGASATSLAVGPFLLALALAVPLVALGSGQRLRTIVSTVVGAVQLAVLVAYNGFTPLDWGLFAAVSTGLQVLARRDSGLRPVRAAGLGLAVLLLAAWPNPLLSQFSAALAAMLLIYGGPALFDLWRNKRGMMEAVQVAAASLAIWLVPLLQFYSWNNSSLAFTLLAVAGAAIAGVAAALGWRCADRAADLRFPLLVTAASLSAAGAAVLGAPEWLVGPLFGAIAVAVLAVSLLADDKRVERVAWAELVAGLGVVLVTPGNDIALAHAAGVGLAGNGFSIAALLMGSAASAAFAWRATLRPASIAAEAASVVLLYGAIAQTVPVRFVPIVAAIMVAGFAAWRGRSVAKRLLPAVAASGMVALMWAVLPVAHWAGSALVALGGVPLFVTDLPSAQDTLLRVAIPGVAIGIAALISAPDRRLLALPAALLMIAAHIVYKQLFGIADQETFAGYGLAERTLWEALLIGAAALLLRVRPIPGRLLLCVGLAHLAWYSLLLHNPLWSAQATGSWPILNLLMPAYTLGFAGLWLLDREFGWRRPIRLARMVLVLLFGWSLIRQMFHGSLLIGGDTGQVEDIARSLLILGSGIAFLLWGILKRQRDWRVAALVLMLVAAAKVFLLDAAGLEGLLRIGSFIALGFALIGIGWLYARFVSDNILGPQLDLTAGEGA